MLSLITLPIREDMEVRPKAKASSLPVNHLRTMMVWARSRFSPPQPKSPLPIRARLKDL